MKIMVVAKKPEHHQRLSEYVPFIRVVFGKFGVVGVQKAVIPKELIFKPIITRNLSEKKIFQTMTRGKAGYNKGQWWMAVNLGLGHNLLIQEVLIHEAAHIAEALKSGNWGHGKEWKSLFETLKRKIL